MSEKHDSTAFFVKLSFRLEDLQRPHLNNQRKPYVVAKTVYLDKIDYENFITDLCVDRWFIEENAELCRIDEDGVWHCILVRLEGCTGGVLVMSEGTAFPKWAAYFPQGN